MRKMFLLFLVLCISTSFTTANVQAIENLPIEDSYNHELKEMARELEQIFTTIIVMDENTGKYVVNEQELNNSSYSEEEKMGFLAFANYLNDNDSLSASNTFKGCMADAFGIAGAVLDEFIGYVENEQWIAAAGVLAAVRIFVNPTTIIVFFLFCGGSTASEVEPQQ
ncbi:hypothetical protein [Sporosarcina sp. UB5]|uniref:hypothetical protein n=1 Tax=Sporosarcina sp. UB5 TaxID=3047463 RepID=UPI003D7A5EB6